MYNTVMRNLEDMTGWTGDVDELAQTASSILSTRAIFESTIEPNVRLIRDYAQRGILSRPERQGKEAVYGYRQLLELVAARTLVADGWPLSKIAEQFVLMEDPELLSLVAGPPVTRTPAQRVAHRLRAETSSLQPTRPHFSNTFRQRATQRSSLQSELRDALRKLGLPEGAPAEEQLTLIAVAPWCQLLMDSDRLNQLTIEEAETLGRAVTAVLLTRNRRK